MKRLIAITFLLAATASASITRGQVCHKYTGNTCTLSSATTAGDALFVAYSYASSGASATCSDGVNTYSVAATAQNTVTTTSLVVAYAANIASSASLTVTCTNESDPGITVVEYSGVATSGLIDGTPGTSNALGTNSSSAVSWPSISPSADDGVFVAGAAENGGALSSFTSPLSLIQNTTNHYDAQADILNVSGGGFTAHATLGGNYGNYWCGVVLAFKAASGGGGGTQPTAVTCCDLGAITTSGGSDLQNLNLLFVPLYAWLYEQTGQVKYLKEGDAIWDSGVTDNVNNGLAWSGKNFSQQYRWSFDYVLWRSQ